MSRENNKKDKNDKKNTNRNTQPTYQDVCVACGAPIPEGHMLCWKCEHIDYANNVSVAPDDIENVDDTDWDDFVFVWENDYMPK